MARLSAEETEKMYRSRRGHAMLERIRKTVLGGLIVAVLASIVLTGYSFSADMAVAAAAQPVQVEKGPVVLFYRQADENTRDLCFRFARWLDSNEVQVVSTTMVGDHTLMVVTRPAAPETAESVE